MPDVEEIEVDENGTEIHDESDEKSEKMDKKDDVISFDEFLKKHKEETEPLANKINEKIATDNTLQDKVSLLQSEVANLHEKIYEMKIADEGDDKKLKLKKYELNQAKDEYLKSSRDLLRLRTEFQIKISDFANRLLNMKLTAVRQEQEQGQEQSQDERREQPKQTTTPSKKLVTKKK
jgi:hypothetical protein